MFADIGPGLKRVQMKLESVETDINLALATRLKDLSRSQLRDCHTPRSITTVRLQFSATTVAWICRANTLMDASVPRCGSTLKRPGMLHVKTGARPAAHGKPVRGQQRRRAPRPHSTPLTCPHLGDVRGRRHDRSV
jgi:hypothetical protein